MGWPTSLDQLRSVRGRGPLDVGPECHQFSQGWGRGQVPALANNLGDCDERGDWAGYLARAEDFEGRSASGGSQVWPWPEGFDSQGAAAIQGHHDWMGCGRAGDRFLGGTDGKATIRLSHQESFSKGQVVTAWEDLWELFEVCRWMSARSEAWSEVFGAGLREMLPPLEKVGLPGEWEKVVFVSSDATTSMVAAIDWKHGLVFRERIADLEPWIRRALEEEDHDSEELVVHLAEMLSFVAFACAVGHRWRGAVVVYGGDNQVVKHWLQSRKAGIRAGRILVRVVNMVEIRYGCVILAGWWRTYHNVDSDYLTRCSDNEYEEFCRKRGFEAVEVKGPIEEALKDTEKFGPCFLSWGQDEDRAGLQRLKEKRMLRQLQKELEVLWEAIYVCEWAAEGREVKDFEEVGVPVPMATVLRKKDWNDRCWIRPERLEVGGGGPQQPLLPQVVGHIWWEKNAERKNLHGTSGPGRWPMLQAPGGPL